ncbi:MAG: SH3 domain-containing protein [Anaerolineae bacterium]
MMVRRWAVVGIVLLGAVGAVYADPVVQVPTETPAVINLSPVTQAAGEQPVGDNAGATATRTPTPEGVALLEAKEFANVRAEPSTESAQLGTIRVGETYNVIGRYVSWIQFEYPSSPNGRGWVYGELVNLSGNIANIPDIDPYSAGVALDSASSGATATQNIITQTPGGVLTATAISRQSSAPGAATPTDSGTRAPEPTYTYPPGMVALAPTAGFAQTTDTSGEPTVAPASSGDSLPPIVPILILGGLGLFGLAISALRRG